jgi:hypothetical protein
MLQRCTGGGDMEEEAEEVNFFMLRLLDMILSEAVRNKLCNK